MPKAHGKLWAYFMKKTRTVRKNFVGKPQNGPIAEKTACKMLRKCKINLDTYIYITYNASTWRAEIYR